MSSKQPATGKTKELKIVTRSVATLADVERSPRLIRLLYVISLAERGISEKALSYLIRELKAQGYDMKYDFMMIGDVPMSRELQNDILLLRYVGLAENNIKRKLVITSAGREFLSKVEGTIPQEERELLRKLYEAVRPKIAPIDAEVEIRASARGTGPRRGARG
ncbi:MAG: hypothetical protein ABWK00_00670 [Desulfurococcaceae archaeon]